METAAKPPSKSPFAGASHLADPVPPEAMTHPDPRDVYLETLPSAESRRTMGKCLANLAQMIRDEAYGPSPEGTPRADGLRMPWWQLRYAHTSRLRYLLTSREPKYAPSTVNKHLAALRGVLKQCWELELMTTDEYTRAKNIEIIKGKREAAGRSIHDDEMQKLLDSCTLSEGPILLRDAALLTVLECTGIRRAEAAALRIEKYDARERKLRVIGKGDKGRTVALHASAVETLEQWLAVLGSRTGPMFPPINRNQKIYKDKHMSPAAVGRVIWRHRERANLPGVSTHDFRRTFGTEFLRRGGNIVLLQQQFGHVSVETTANYSRHDEDEIRDAVDQMRVVVPRYEGESLARELTTQEQQAIASLRELARKWPQSLMLFGGGDDLYVFHIADRDALMEDWNGNEDLLLATVSGIPNDGGDP